MTSSRLSSTSCGSRSPRRISDRPSRYGAIGSVFTRRCFDGHELLDDRPDLALVEQVGPAAQRPAEDAVAPRVERLDAGAEAGQARRHLLLRLLVVGEGDHRLALVAAVGEEVAVALGEDTRSCPTLPGR